MEILTKKIQEELKRQKIYTKGLSSLFKTNESNIYVNNNYENSDSYDSDSEYDCNANKGEKDSCESQSKMDKCKYEFDSGEESNNKMDEDNYFTDAKIESRFNLRDAVIAKEILDKPLCKRGRRKPRGVR